MWYIFLCMWCTFLYIIHIYTHMLFSMTGAVSYKCGICISRSPPVLNEMRVLHPYIFLYACFDHFTFYICSSLANFICWLKPTENEAYCIVYCIVYRISTRGSYILRFLKNWLFGSAFRNFLYLKIPYYTGTKHNHKTSRGTSLISLKNKQ